MREGDFEADTAVTLQDGRWTARLSKAWEIWGPNGGYLAAIALRAAGACTTHKRPASFAGHFLAVASFDEVELEVTSLRQAKRAESLRVSMIQKDRCVFEAIVWVVDEGEGLEHDDTAMPDVPGVMDLRPIEELQSSGTMHSFWSNFERRPINWIDPNLVSGRAPRIQQWLRFRPRATFEDPFLDAARCLLLLDTMTWPAAWQHHGDKGYIAPSLDIHVSFHRPAPAHEWLLIDAHAPIASAGLVAANAQAWSEDGKLLASGMAQLYCRPNPMRK